MMAFVVLVLTLLIGMVMVEIILALLDELMRGEDKMSILPQIGILIAGLFMCSYLVLSILKEATFQ